MHRELVDLPGIHDQEVYFTGNDELPVILNVHTELDRFDNLHLEPLLGHDRPAGLDVILSFLENPKEQILPYRGAVHTGNLLDSGHVALKHLLIFNIAQMQGPTGWSEEQGRIHQATVSGQVVGHRHDPGTVIFIRRERRRGTRMGENKDRDVDGLGQHLDLGAEALPPTPAIGMQAAIGTDKIRLPNGDELETFLDGGEVSSLDDALGGNLP